MRKVLYILMLGMLSLGVQAQKLTLNDVNLNPGGYATLYVSLDCPTALTAVTVKLTLPVGVTVASNEDGDMDIFAAEGSICKDHTLASSYSAIDNSVKVMCISMTNAEFKATSGKIFGIRLFVSEYFKPGNGTITASGTELVTKAGDPVTAIEEPAAQVTIGTAASASITILSANKYGTLVLPFSTALPTGVKAYYFQSFNSSNDTLYMTPDTELKAFVPYVLYAPNGVSQTVTGTVDVSGWPANGEAYASTDVNKYLVGMLNDYLVYMGYVLQNINNKVCFYRVESNGGSAINVPAGRCYLKWKPEASGNARSMMINFGGDQVLAIEDVAALSDIISPTTDIMGRTVNGSHRGLGISNGKLIYVK